MEEADSFLPAERSREEGWDQEGNGKKASWVRTAAEGASLSEAQHRYSVPLVFQGPTPWKDPLDRPCVISK